MKRLILLLGLLLAVMGGQAALLDGSDAYGASDAWTVVPETVREAADRGRYWRAARLLDRHLAGAADTTPATVLLAARLGAGWRNWPAVARLLDGRPWLDGLDGGAGWELLGRARIALGEHEAGAAALAAYLSAAERLDPYDEGLAELRLGLALGRVDGEAGEDGEDGEGRVERALAALDRAADRLPWLADWVGYLAAETAARAGDVAEVERRLASAGETPGHWRLRATAALVAGDTMAAREAALGATRTGPAADRSEAWAELGRLRLAAGDTARARRAFGRAMDVPSSMGAVDAARRVSELGPGPEEWRVIAAVYRRHGNAARAAEGYEAYLASGAGTAAERVRARLGLGRARFDAGRFAEAEAELLALADDDVPDRVAAEALYLAGRAQYRRGRPGAGRATFLRLADRYPGDEFTARGLYLLADLKHDDLETDGPDGARGYYRRAADAAPDVNEAGLALMRLAGLAYADGEYADAAEVWEEYRRRHPEGRRSGQATYWAARAYQRLGRDSLADARLRQARAADPLGFYGIRAAERLGVPVLDIPMADAPPPDPAIDSAVEAGLRRVDVLAALDRRDELLHEVERLRRRFRARSSGSPAGEYALAEALNERGHTLTGIGMGWELYGRTGEWNPRLLRVIYPFPYRNLVVPEALERGLDPHLVAGLIRRESAFSSAVVSGAGAIGLMQIVPETGRALARAAGLPGFDSELLTRPEVNVHLGTRFFAELLDRFGDELPLVLAAYNAGPTRATRWRELPEADDPELFTERVPYGETRDYIRHVLAHRALYRALYPEAGRAAGGAGIPAGSAGPGR